MSDLDDEIRSHIQHEIDDNLARGMTRDQAERAAFRKFGNRTKVKEDVWRLRPWAWLDGVRQDLVYALRMMGKNWGFTAIAVASLGLGIGGNTALFSLVDRLMLRTLPVREPERLVLLDLFEAQHLRSTMLVNPNRAHGVERTKNASAFSSGVSFPLTFYRKGPMLR